MRQSLTQESLGDPVTRHMHRNLTRLHLDQSVGEALEQLRREQPGERILYLYVVDAEDRLVGVVPVRRFLLSAPAAALNDVMIRNVVAVPAAATVLDACEFFILHRFLAFPVVDDQRRLLGVIDVELYTDELSEIDGEQRDDLFDLVGVHLAQARRPSALAAFRSRFPWLLCNVAGGLLAAVLSWIFQDVLSRDEAVMALFVPVVLALAESVSIQSVSLALQGLHGQPPTWPALARGMGRELSIGLLLGGGTGLLVGLTALVFVGKASLAGSLLGGIGAGVAAAAVLGLAVPNLLHLLRLNPSIAAGPLALALADMLTLVCYFSLGRWLMGP